MGQSISSNASWGNAGGGWSGGSTWTCSQCGQSVYGSHICQYPIWPITPPAPVTITSDTLILQEMLELIRELHSVIFRQRVENDLERENCDECEHCGK